MIKTKQLYSVS